jgi:hypothetical protein
VPAAVANLEPDPDDFSLAIAPDGSRALAGTAAGLSLVTLSDGHSTPTLEGRWARWFVPDGGSGGVSPPEPTPFATPGLTPSPRPSPTFPPGEADLTGEPVAATCVIGQQLAVRISNLGPGAVDREVFIRVASLDGQTRQGATNVGLLGLKPGESREVRTSYVVQETVQVIIDYPRDRRPENNAITCAPRP